ncbi:DsbA family protein [Nocardioides deserti]|uniref:Thioredoxin domain-containing protein n=1 Tax=Nocardioides deserti TaxID=1588644 RepID=A0ABR6U5F3_9ACTN|nr:thioredoxin domain-containing protein [Nocardioides deserti]MBC2959388.1 thioredoxin domain-containing protein [Nocardioides deserti]GGO73359.1 hypothetical protein GCM10012276_18750 [Nocardioides deserti]
MTKQLKLSLTLAGAFAILVVTLLTAAALRSDNSTDGNVTDDGNLTTTGESRLVRSDSHILGTPAGATPSSPREEAEPADAVEAVGDSVTFVEFLDFECEACRSAYPFVEELRAEYEGRVTFVARYFPMPGHFNADRAARAVEASARQGAFEAMYQRMYETQEQWGGQRVPLDDLFRSFAEDLNLDMAAWDAAYASRATSERVAKDVEDGIALGVQGTPTFFIDGKRLEPRIYGDFADALDAALAD